MKLRTRSDLLLSLAKFSLFVYRSLSPVKLASLPPLWWQLRGDEWHSSFSLSVCPSPPVSLCQSFQWLPAQICQADGGPAFYMSLEGRPGNTICGPTMQCFWTLSWSTERRIDATPCVAQIPLKNPSVSCLSVSTFCRAPLEELCIFYLSLEIRLDPDESIGCTHRHTASRTRTQMGLLLLLKSRQLWRERGGTVGICICRWEKKLHLPQGPAVEMNQLSMVCRSDPILLITKSQNNKDQKVVGHAVCSSFVVP